MASSFKPEDAMRVMRSPNEQAGEKQTVSLNKDYYSLETGEPISFESLTKRLKKRFADIDKATVGAMLDLVFLHANFATFYKRQESFSDYLKTLNLSRTHAYGIINSVGLLTQYFAHRGESAPQLGTFLQEVAGAVEELGIRRLIVISQVKDEEKRFELVDRLLSGEAITAEELEQKVDRKAQPVEGLSEVGDTLSIRDKPVLTFQPELETGLKKVILAAVAKYLRKKGN